MAEKEGKPPRGLSLRGEPAGILASVPERRFPQTLKYIGCPILVFSINRRAMWELIKEGAGGGIHRPQKEA